jgi:hypothetical protein
MGFGPHTIGDLRIKVANMELGHLDHECPELLQEVQNVLMSERGTDEQELSIQSLRALARIEMQYLDVLQSLEARL